MKSVRIKAELRQMYWPGNKVIQLRARVVEGPQAFLDRMVNISLTFEDIDQLESLVAEARQRLEETEKRLADMARRNSAEENKE